MRQARLVAEIFYDGDRQQYPAVVVDDKGKNIAELPTKAECIAFCLETYGQAIILVQRYRHNIMIIEETL